MAVSESNIVAWTEALSELRQVAGAAEQTRIVPNLLVIDAAPPAPLTGYIIVRNEQGVYSPVLKLPTAAYAANDYVNVVYMKGTEPVAFSQGSASPSAAVKVYELWENDFGAVAWQTDAAGNLTNQTVGQTIALDGNFVSVIVNSVTRTVRASGGNHTTIQAAIDWFKGKVIIGACIIDVEAGTYSETITIEDIFIATTGSLTIQGDTRLLAGLAYVDGCAINPGALTNGGSGAGALSNVTTTLTVTGASTSPDFDADGWGSGDKLLTYSNSNVSAEFTVSSVANNVWTLTATAPTIGNDGTAIALKPNRIISRATAGATVTVDGVRGVKFQGFHFDTATGANCIGVQVNNGALVEIANCSTDAEDYGYYADGYFSAIKADGGAVTAWVCDRGFFANQTGQIIAMKSAAQACTTYGYIANNFAYLNASNCNACKNGTAYRAGLHAQVLASSSYARTNTTGFSSGIFGRIFANGVSTLVNGNGTNYVPTVTPPNYAQGTDFAVIYVD